MTAKEYLGQLKLLDTKINQMLEELEMMKEKAASTGGIDYSKDKVQTSVSDKVGNMVSTYLDLGEEINREIDRMLDNRYKLIKQIQKLNVNNYIQVLFKVYVQFQPLRSVSSEMGFSYQHTRKLHNEALTMFERTYKNLQDIS